jgi:hypothetical protein
MRVCGGAEEGSIVGDGVATEALRNAWSAMFRQSRECGNPEVLSLPRRQRRLLQMPVGRPAGPVAKRVARCAVVVGQPDRTTPGEPSSLGGSEGKKCVGLGGRGPNQVRIRPSRDGQLQTANEHARRLQAN